MPSVYYAVCPGTGGTDDKKTGSPTITIASGVATLSVAQTGNIGQGFRITYDTSKVCFISKVKSSTSFDVVTATGGTPSDEASAVTVNSIAADYASLSAAEAGASDSSHLNTSNLVTATTILNLVCYAGASADTTYCNIDGWTTSADYYCNVYTPRGLGYNESITRNRHLGVSSSSYYRLVSSGSNGIGLLDDYHRLNGLDISGWSYSSGTRSGVHTSESARDGCYVENCLIHEPTDCAATLVGLWLANGCDNWVIRNNIVYNIKTASCAASHGIRLSRYGTMRNCTVFGCGIGIYCADSSGNNTVVNSAIFNNDDDFSVSSYVKVTYTASDDNDISGTGNVDLADSAASWNAQFVDYDATNPDVRLVGNSLLLMTGIGPASDANVPTTDIVGTSRSGNTCDIGAFEFVDEGGSSPKWNGITPAKWNGIDWSNLKWNGM